MSVVCVILDISTKKGFDMDIRIPEGGYLRFNDFEQAWASDDGSYGGEGIILYNPEDLTEQQRSIAADMYDYTRVEYIMAVLDGDDEQVEALEADYV
jgi:hypothetical protein